MKLMGGKLYIQANAGYNGFELWVSDGTQANTSLLQLDIQAETA